MPNRRGVARREQILDAAIELFAQRGYRGAGLIELAERVGMTHAGILHHFGTKEDLLRAVAARRDEIQDRAARAVAEAGLSSLPNVPVPDEPEMLVRLATVLRAESLDPEAPLHEYFDTTNRRSRAVIAAEIRRAQERGEVRADVDPDVKALEIMAFNFGLDTQWLLAPDTVDRVAAYHSFLRMLVDDLTRPDAPRRAPGDPSS